jgi:hypothetical protein
MNVADKTFVNTLIDIIKADIKIGAKAVEANIKIVESFLKTLGAISNLGASKYAITANDGVSHSLSEYMLDKRLKPLVTPRGVSINASETSPELMVKYWEGNKLTKSQVEQALIGFAFENKPKSQWGDETKLKPMDYIKVGAREGDIAIAADYDSQSILTPGEFKVAQSILFSWFKSNYESSVSMEELTKPALLMDVIDRVDDGVNTLSNILDTMAIPVTLKCARFIYEPYMYNYPLTAFYREFALNFVVNSLNAKPIQD